MKKVSSLLLFFGILLSAFAQGGLTEKQRKAIEEEMAPLRLKVEGILQKENPKMYDSYKADLAKALSINLASERKIALAELENKYLSFVKKGYSTAKIDEIALKAKLTNILKTTNYTIKFTPFMGITGTYTSPTPPATGNNCFEFKCPYSVTNTTMSQNAFVATGHSTDNGCFLDTRTTGAFAAGREDISAGGEYVSISPNMARVDVSSEVDYDISARAGAVIGGTYADAAIGFLIDGPSMNNTRLESVSGWALAPIVWWNEFRATGQNNRIQTSFTPSALGGDYKVQAYAKTYAFAAVLGAAQADSRLENIDYIKVCQIKK